MHKKLLLPFIAISAFALAACEDDNHGGEDCSKNYCKNETTAVKCVQGESLEVTCKDDLPVCSNGECVAKPCNSSEECKDSAKPYCNPDTKKCEAPLGKECKSDTDCTDPIKTLCDIPKGICYAGDGTIPVDGLECAKGDPSYCDSKGQGHICKQNRDNKTFAYTTIPCANSDCVICSNNYLACGNEETVCAFGPCTPDSQYQCKGTCSDDHKIGYFWSSTANELQTRDCSEKADCQLDGTFVTCTSDSEIPDTIPAACKEGDRAYCIEQDLFICNGSKKTYVRKDTCDGVNKRCVVDNSGFGSCLPVEFCTAKSTFACTGKCADASTGYYWSDSTSKVETMKCPNADCVDTDGYVSCTSTSPVKSDETCDPKNAPKSCTDANTVKYCHEGYYYTKACNTCKVSDNGKNHCCDGNDDKCTPVQK